MEDNSKTLHMVLEKVDRLERQALVNAEVADGRQSLVNPNPIYEMYVDILEKCINAA